ncbi:MAG: signal peptidase II [Synergistetes bacterium]|nr:signal peptidase II [Synergistota bacterium]
MRLSVKEAGLFITCIGIDRLSKIWALENLWGGEGKTLLLPFLRLKLTFNEGSLWGLKVFENNLWWIVITAILIGGLYFFHINKTGFKIGRSLIVSGAIGNLIDRLSYGKVIDFISIYKWPIFNLADAFMTIGLIFLFMIFFINRDDNN